ncbi:MAG: hypothetical protein SGJ19_27540 [Planctomycetia bacterium]|nr:hypothetical protein [Planctomycetia bacterium]
MLTDYLAYRTASDQIRAFASVGENPDENRNKSTLTAAATMEAAECESFLQLGIDAFHWLIRADEQYRKAVFSGALEYDSSFDASFDEMAQRWLKSGAAADAWIESLAGRGLAPANLHDFRECLRQIRSIVEENDEVTGEIAVLRDQAIEAYHAGDTDEWTP